MTQADLAKCLRRPQSFVCKYETKQRRLDVVEFLEVTDCLHRNSAEMITELSGIAPKPREFGGPARFPRIVDAVSSETDGALIMLGRSAAKPRARKPRGG